jgi:hypothetical protein
MFGIILMALGTLMGEANASIAKTEVAAKKESIYTLGFLNTLLGAIIYAMVGITTGNFYLNPASFPTLALRIVLEIFQSHLTLIALITSERSTFSFFRVLTLPLLLLVDVFLGYLIGWTQVIGITFTVGIIFFLFLRKDLSLKGFGPLVITTFIPVITISLYKYHITNFNSVAGEQVVVCLFLAFYFLLMAGIRTKENPIAFLRKPIFMLQSGAEGVGAVLEAFAYQFGPASVILTAKRSTSVLWSILAGHQYFHEHKFGVKLFSALVLLGSLYLLIS